MNCPHCGKAIIAQPKSITSPQNAVGWQRPHFAKVEHFLNLGLFDKLECVEWIVKIPLRKGTYNPDYYHPASNTYVEITTSLPNISEQRRKWQEAMRSVKLRVFWWQGLEVTEKIRTGSKITGIQKHVIGSYEEQVDPPVLPRDILPK